MPSPKPFIKNDRINKDGKSNINIRICHKGKAGFLKTPYYIEPHYLGPDGKIKKSYPGHTTLNNALMKILLEYNEIIANIGSDIRQMDINDLLSRLRNSEGGGASFTKYATQRMELLNKQGRTSYATSYKSMLNHVKDFSEKDSLLFKDINLNFLQEFERYLKKKDKRVNTIRIYLNNIKAIFYHAYDNNIIKLDVPFRKFKVKKEKTVKRSLTVGQLKELSRLPVTEAQQRAKDLFFLSFFLAGINFKDLLFLTEKNIVKDRIEYMRYKTKDKKPEKISVQLFSEASELLNKYKGEKHLLYFLDSVNQKRKTDRYKDIVKDTNKLLKRIAIKMKVDTFTTYASRHSFATIGYQLDIKESTISELLGHSSGDPMTNVYIKRDYKKQDEAHKRIIDSLRTT